MAFAVPLAMAATAIGAGISAYGQYQAGQAQAAQYGYQANVANQIAAAETQAGNVTEYAGFRAAESTGLQSRAAIGRQAVSYGAQNVAGGSVGQVLGSQIALGRQSEAETAAQYGETAYQQRLTGAEKAATAGLYTMAAQQAPIAGDIGALGSVVGGVGSVASKWYQSGALTGSSAPYTGGSDLAIY